MASSTSCEGNAQMQIQMTDAQWEEQAAKMEREIKKADLASKDGSKTLAEKIVLKSQLRAKQEALRQHRLHRFDLTA